MAAKDQFIRELTGRMRQEAIRGRPAALTPDEIGPLLDYITGLERTWNLAQNYVLAAERHRTAEADLCGAVGQPRPFSALGTALLADEPFVVALRSALAGLVARESAQHHGD